MIKSEWILCPICGNKTRTQLRENTILMNYPLYCPKCKQETLIEAKQFHVTIIKKDVQKKEGYKKNEKVKDYFYSSIV